MRRILLFVLALMVVIGLIYSNPIEKKIEPADKQEESMLVNYESTDITVMLEEEMDYRLINEVKDAASYYPQAVLTSFNDTGWKVMIVSEIDYTDSEQTAEPNDLGLINFKTKTIQVRDVGLTGAVRLTLLHEMAHFTDYYYGFASCEDDFAGIWDKYQDTYVEFGLQDEPFDKNDPDIAYATLSPQEMFACGLKDYLYNTDYLLSEYPDMAIYFKDLLKEGPYHDS